MTQRLVLSGLPTHFLMFWEEKNLCQTLRDVPYLWRTSSPKSLHNNSEAAGSSVAPSWSPSAAAAESQTSSLMIKGVPRSRSSPSDVSDGAKKRCKPPRRWLVKADQWACLGVTGGSRWTSGDVRFQHGNHLSFTFWGKTGFQATTNQLQEFPLSQFFSVLINCLGLSVIILRSGPSIPMT